MSLQIQPLAKSSSINMAAVTRDTMKREIVAWISLLLALVVIAVEYCHGESSMGSHTTPFCYGFPVQSYDGNGMDVRSFNKLGRRENYSSRHPGGRESNTRLRNYF
jgi:hypothetical protein